MRIGIFGGTFNPIHIGHLIVAQESLVQMQLDKVLFVVAFLPPHKNPEEIEIIDAQDRYQMTALAIADNPRFEISDIEIKRGGISYTIDTVKELRSMYGEKTEFFLIIGADTINEISKWKNPEELSKLVQFIVAPRAGYQNEQVNPPFKISTKLLSMPTINISSTEIRNRAKMGLPIRYWVPEPTYRYLISKKLYGINNSSCRY